MLNTEKITIQVTPEAAKAFRSASESERKKMREISRSAKERGLTAEILNDLLKD
jgi:hypothetical protein